MTWQPPEETDSATRAWMSKESWPVTATHYSFDRLIYCLAARRGGQVLHAPDHEKSY